MSAGNIGVITQYAEHEGTSTKASKDEAAVARDLPGAEGGSMPQADFELAAFPVKSEAAKLQVPRCPITGTAIFAATKLLMAIADDVAISRTAKQDTESLCWVFIFVAYKMAFRDESYPNERTSLLVEEFMVFAAINIQDIIDRRAIAFLRTTQSTAPGIRHLRTYLTHAGHDALRECVEYVWITLFRLQQNLKVESTPPPDVFIKRNRALEREAGGPNMSTVPTYEAEEYKDPTEDLITVFKEYIHDAALEGQRVEK